jgi:anti-sigma factor RsiW
MTRCPENGVLQDFLEGLLPADAHDRMERHLEACPQCAAERLRLERLFARLESLPLESPSPALAERVLDRVLPARRRVRWARRLGLGYAVSVVACVLAFGAWITQPSARAFLSWLAAEASGRVFHSLMFVVNSISFVALNVAGGWGALSAIGSRLSPLARALLVVADHGLVQLALAVLAVLWLSVVWWLRQRHGRSGKGMPHVGVVGF